MVTKLVNQLLLGSVAFGTSLILGIMVHRDVREAFLTGGIGVTACYTAATVTNKRRNNQETRDRDSLYCQIQSLENKETQLCQSLASTTAIHKELEASIEALQVERTQLLHRVSELHLHRNALYKHVSKLQQQRQQQETVYLTKQTQLQLLERRKDEINQSLHVQLTQIRPTQKRLQSLQEEFEQIQRQILERQELHQQIDFSVVALENQKNYLEVEVANLHEQLHDLENLYEQISYSILNSRTNKQQLEEKLSIEKEELEKLQEQAKQLTEKKEASVARSSTLDTFLPIIPKEWLEWLKFYDQLNEDDKAVLEAILEQDEAALKKLADREVTMTEVLIDSLNESAVNILGDAIFVRNSVSIIPDIYEEYLHILQEPTAVYLKDILKIEK